MGHIKNRDAQYYQEYSMLIYDYLAKYPNYLKTIAYIIENHSSFFLHTSQILYRYGLMDSSIDKVLKKDQIIREAEQLANMSISTAKGSFVNGNVSEHFRQAFIIINKARLKTVVYFLNNPNKLKRVEQPFYFALRFDNIFTTMYKEQFNIEDDLPMLSAKLQIAGAISYRIGLDDEQPMD